MTPQAPRSKEAYRLLLICPDYEEIDRLTGLLTPFKFECYYALDVPSAIAEWNRLEPHLIMLDWRFPDPSGLLSTLRNDSYIPVLVQGDPGDVGQELRAFKEGADGYLGRRSDSRLLVATVMAILRRTYRYTRLLAVGEERDPSGTRVKSWQTATCDHCGFSGPYPRFETEDAMGRKAIRCPNCKESDFIIFSME